MFCMQISFCLTSVCKSGGGIGWFFLRRGTFPAWEKCPPAGGKPIGEITPRDKTVPNP